MSKAHTLLVFALLSLPSLAQQPEFIQVRKNLSAEPPTLTVTNNYHLPITAFVMTANPYGAGSKRRSEVRTYHDIFVNRGVDFAIAAGASQEVQIQAVAGVDPSTVEPMIRAVIFADGRTTGEQRWIQNLLQQRKRLHAALGIVGRVVNDVLEGRRELQAAVDYLRTLRDDAAKAQYPSLHVKAMDVAAFHSGFRTLEAVVLSTGSEADRTGQVEAVARHISSRIAEIESAKPDFTHSDE